jgi:endogenous inhibitor of DNA gyrase (YacG/DUF329 family)
MTTTRDCVTCGTPITVTTRNPNRRYCSARCRSADWHTRNRATNAVANGANAARDDVANDVAAQFTNRVHAANGVARCPHCHHELAVIAVVIPADAAHVHIPQVFVDGS